MSAKKDTRHVWPKWVDWYHLTCMREKKSTCDSLNAETTDVKFTVENILKVNQFLDDGNDTNSNNAKFESYSSTEIKMDEWYLL